MAFYQELFRGLKEEIKAGKMRIYVNCGDHAHVAAGLRSELKVLGIEYADVLDNTALEEMCHKEPLHALSDPEGCKAVTICHFDSHFAAFRCTDLLCRISDILVTKPSELAFFPIPKLHIRRVGAHEAFSAERASELGDGTVECRTVATTLKKMAKLMEEESPLFALMNRCIISAGAQKIYEGSRIAVEHALGLTKED